MTVVIKLQQLFSKTFPSFLFNQHRMANNYINHNQIRKLQIGSGPNVLPGWLNTDLIPGKEIIFMDATKRLPFKDSTFDYVFSEHFIEHIEYPVGIQLVKECSRILKPEGRLRIATPNLQFLINLFTDNKTDVQKRYIKWATDNFVHIQTYSESFVVNNFFRDWGHKFIYDYKTLENMLNNCGFINIEQFELGESRDRNLRGIESHGHLISDEFNKLESMAIEGMKP